MQIGLLLVVYAIFLCLYAYFLRRIIQYSEEMLSPIS